MNNNRIIIEITNSVMNLLAVRHQRGRKATVLSGSYQLVDGRLPDEAIECLARFDPKRESEVILVHPRRQVILKYYSLPSRDSQELRRMVKLRIGQGLPFPCEEAVCDIAVGETDTDGYTRVVAAVARRRVVEQYLTLSGRSNIHPSCCAVGAFGIAAWHARRYPGDANQTVLVADAWPGGVDLCYLLKQKLAFTRSLAFVDASTADEIARQLRLTETAFQREYPGLKARKIVLTGTARNKSLLQEIFRRELLLPVEEAGVQDDHSVDQQRDDPGAGGTSGESFGALWGLAFSEELGPNLIPSSMIAAKVERARRLALLRLGAAIASVAGAFVLSMGMDLHRQVRYRDALKERLAATQKEAEDARRKIKIFQFVQGQTSDQILFADLIKELYRILPEQTSLRSLQISEGTLIMQGQSKENSDVNSIQKKMMDSAFFKDVTLQYAIRTQDLMFTEFRIVCRLRISDEERL